MSLESDEKDKAVGAKGSRSTKKGAAGLARLFGGKKGLAKKGGASTQPPTPPADVSTEQASNPELAVDAPTAAGVAQKAPVAAKAPRTIKAAARRRATLVPPPLPDASQPEPDDAKPVDPAPKDSKQTDTPAKAAEPAEAEDDLVLTASDVAPRGPMEGPRKEPVKVPEADPDDPFADFTPTKSGAKKAASAPSDKGSDDSGKEEDADKEGNDDAARHAELLNQARARAAEALAARKTAQAEEEKAAASQPEKVVADEKAEPFLGVPSVPSVETNLLDVPGPADVVPKSPPPAAPSVSGPDAPPVAPADATVASPSDDPDLSKPSTPPPPPAGDDGLLRRDAPAPSQNSPAGRDLLDAEAQKALDKKLAAETEDRRDPEVDDRRSEPRNEPGGGDRRGRLDGWSFRPSRQTSDDALLGCLTILCTLLQRPISSDALTAGLPLDEGHVTPDLFIRAAERAGISARLGKRRLEDISNISLPCVVLLEGKRAAVLTEIKSKGRVTIVLPEMGSGARDVAFDELKAEYSGYTLFARPEFQFDNRAEEVRVRDPKGWFWGTVMKSWKLYVEVMVAAMLINLFAIASPLFTMNVYDRVVPNFAEETLWVLAIGVVLVFVFDFILKLLRAYLVDIAGKTADTKIAARLFQQMLGMKMAYRPPSAGGLANQMREFESIREFFTSSTLVALIDLPFIFMFVAIIYVIGGPVAIVPAAVVFVVVPIGMLMQIPMKRIVQETFREAQQKHAILIEAISGIETIKATASEGRMQKSWETFVSRTARSAMMATRWSQIATNFSSFAMQMVTVLVIIYGVYLIQEGELTVGALVACTILSGRALAPLGQIAAIATRFHQARNSLTALDGMMQTPVERPEGRSFVHRNKFAGHIEFKKVAFAYPEAKTTALTDINFDIPAGERVGIIGRIGSGKSTIERLVMGLYDPTEGAVLVDGTDTRQIDPADLRRSIGVVPQDTYLFFGSVKENIALGAPYADDEMILRAARIAGVDEFTARHPLGLDMPVGERGQSLSGGQRQSISIARALLLDPPILMMDEPTSSMDNTTEGRFKQRLQSVLPNRTLLMVTHRGSLLTLVDRLLVLDGGRLLADGPKEQVMEALASGRIQTAKV